MRILVEPDRSDVTLYMRLLVMRFEPKREPLLQV